MLVALHPPENLDPLKLKNLCSEIVWCLSNELMTIFGASFNPLGFVHTPASFLHRKKQKTNDLTLLEVKHLTKTTKVIDLCVLV